MEYHLSTPQLIHLVGGIENSLCAKSIGACVREAAKSNDLVPLLGGWVLSEGKSRLGRFAASQLSQIGSTKWFKHPLADRLIVALMEDKRGIPDKFGIYWGEAVGGAFVKYLHREVGIVENRIHPRGRVYLVGLTPQGGGIGKAYCTHCPEIVTGRGLALLRHLNKGNDAPTLDNIPACVEYLRTAKRRGSAWDALGLAQALQDAEAGRPVYRPARLDGVCFWLRCYAAAGFVSASSMIAKGLDPYFIIGQGLDQHRDVLKVLALPLVYGGAHKSIFGDGVSWIDEAVPYIKDKDRAVVEDHPLWDVSLSDTANLSVIGKVASKLYANWCKTFPEIKAWIDEAALVITDSQHRASFDLGETGEKFGFLKLAPKYTEEEKAIMEDGGQLPFLPQDRFDQFEVKEQGRGGKGWRVHCKWVKLEVDSTSLSATSCAIQAAEIGLRRVGALEKGCTTHDGFTFKWVDADRVMADVEKVYVNYHCPHPTALSRAIGIASPGEARLNCPGNLVKFC